MFYFRLARELHMTVARLLTEADSAEIAGWQAYFKLEKEMETRRKTKASVENLRAGLKAAGQAAARKRRTKDERRRTKDDQKRAL